MKPSAAVGMARLARFCADGLSAFDASPPGLLAALAPWLAFALVGSGLELLNGQPLTAATDLLASVVALLAPPVLSQALALAWGRDAAWLRYSVAMTWCQWLIFPALLGGMLAHLLLTLLGAPAAVVHSLAALGVLGYALALQLFITRTALVLPLWRAAVTVVAVNLGTLMVTFGPLVLAGAGRTAE
jgi:hypothetical protein